MADRGGAGQCLPERRAGEEDRAEKDALTALQAHLTAWVDFPEEDVPALEDAQLIST